MQTGGFDGPQCREIKMRQPCNRPQLIMCAVGKDLPTAHDTENQEFSEPEINPADRA